MDITVKRTLSVGRDSTSDSGMVDIPGKGRRRDRRKNKHDRRKSVRDGVYVSLSFIPFSILMFRNKGLGHKRL